MPLALQNANLSDIPTFAFLQSTAFQQANPLDRLMFPSGSTPSVLACAVVSHEKAFHNAATHYMKVIDTTEICPDSCSAGQIVESYAKQEIGHGSDIENQLGNRNIIGFARWYVWREDRSAAEWDVPRNVRSEDLGPVGDVNHQVAAVFLSQLREQKRRFVQGRKCVCKSLHLYVVRKCCSATIFARSHCIMSIFRSFFQHENYIQTPPMNRTAES